MDKRYLIVKLDEETYRIEVDKPQAVDFDDCIIMIHGTGNKTRIVDEIVQVKPKGFAIGKHIIVVTHIIGMPGLRETWALLPKHTYLEKSWTSYFKHIIETRQDLSKLPERYISSEAIYGVIKHD